jgi:alpha,alpha-trehalase
MSHDEMSRSAPRRFLIDVEEMIRLVLEQEDTDGDFRISITDAGPKIVSLGTATSNGFKTFDIRVRSITILSRLATDGMFVQGHLHVV